MIEFPEIQRVTKRRSVKRLEIILKPTNPENNWKNSSGGGFLGPDESLLEVLESDYNTLCSLGKTYEEMAELASNVLKQTGRESFVTGNDLTRKLKRFFIRNLFPVARIDRERFTPMYISSFGVQTCPWGCSEDNFGYQTTGSGHIYIMEKSGEGVGLMEHYNEGRHRILTQLGHGISEEDKEKLIRDFERGLGIEFGGMDRVLYLSAFTVITDLTPHLIASHYFFEGDACYRTDPAKLLEVVS